MKAPYKWWVKIQKFKSAELRPHLSAGLLLPASYGAWLSQRADVGAVAAPRWRALPTLHEELSGARRRRIKIALQKDTTREVLEGWQALEGWLP